MHAVFVHKNYFQDKLCAFLVKHGHIFVAFNRIIITLQTDT